jgi:Tol biopolymer transport system component
MEHTTLTNPSRPQNENFIGKASAQTGAQFSRFDRAVLGVIAALVLVLVAVLLLGDRVGVTLNRAGPLGEDARSTSPIILGFSENMNRDTLPDYLTVAEVSSGTDPQTLTGAESLATVTGSIQWTGRTAFFRPAEPLTPGASYVVRLAAGFQSEDGRAVLSEYRFGFTVRRPRVVYLGPATDIPNLYVVDPSNPAAPQQVTSSPSGVWDPSVSLDGRQIAFAEKNTATGTSDLKLINLETGELRQLTNCADADCTVPVWRPDGQVIGYQRVDFNSDLPNVPVSPTRIWLLDMNTGATRPMFNDTQVLGFGLVWSADGSRASLYDYSTPGILVHDFATNETTVVPSQYGSPGILSPDGTKLIYPEVILSDAQARSYLRLVDLTNQTDEPISDPDEPIDDDNAAWSPDGTKLAVARRYLDERYTRGRQLYLLDMTTGETETLLFDEQYMLGFFSWDANGTSLLIQRFPDPVALNDPENRGIPELWILDVPTKALTKVADNAMFGRWLP